MKIRKLISFSYSKSLYVKVLISLVSALTVIIVFIEVSSIYVLNIYEKRAKATYQSSLKLYSDYWDGKLGSINTSLITLFSSNDTYYDDIYNSTDTLNIETSKVMLTKKLNEIVRMNNNQISAFIYVPDRNIYLKSSNVLLEYKDSGNLDNGIKKFIESAHIRNGGVWQLLHVGEKSFFVVTFNMNNGYAGAIIDCKSILNNLMEDKSIVGAAAFVDANNVIGYKIENGIKFNESSSLIFSENLNHINYKIEVIVSERKLYSDKTFLILIMIGILIIGIIVIFFSVQMQKKIVLNPLNILKKAMEKFSSGEMDVRLKENSSSIEINTLYQTFNFMAEQITNLKIDVYESEIEKREIQSSFLRVQIQPHFYSNILNLIYGLAEMGDYKNIQQISLLTSRYFRYLLSNKNTFVSLDKEIECVENYVQIQCMRYPEFLKLQIKSSVNASTKLVPPLILQTFVENSIKHNVTYVPLLYTYVDISQEFNKLIINIKDNGLGFSPDLLERLNADENISIDGKHIGIVNVKQRLKLIYGEEARVTFESRKNETIVHIEIPDKDE